MDRRDFMKQVLLWSAGISTSIPSFRIGSELLAAEKTPALVSHATGKNYGELVARVLAPLGGIGNFVKTGDRVVIKPNMAWDRSPEQAANTHPLVVKALVEQTLDAGAKKIMVFDRTCNEERRCYVNSGIQEAMESIKDKRLEYYHPDARKFVPVNIERGKAVNRLEIYRDALEADAYINVPVAKHHGLSKLTLGLKNSMGVLGGNRGQMHHNLGQKLADLATVIRPKLTVIDATRILLRNGPQGGDLDDVKILDTIVASADPVACDAFATTLFNMQPDEIASTVAAYRLGLGEMDLARMQIIQA
ncbi:MAG: cytoplasmic protein [Desulfobacterales bacterium SG8_35]|nr:MAG: cytoplasmic protein [Desulfobacterales bacterium SG8_35]